MLTAAILLALAATPALAGNLIRDSDPSGDLKVWNHPAWRYLEHEDCGSGNQGRIVGGHTPDLGSYPWIVLIGYTDRHSGRPQQPDFRCGGSLISPRYVLTASHCIVESTSPKVATMVRLGEHDRDNNPDCDPIVGVCAPPVQDIDIEELFSYIGYGVHHTRKGIYDIALLRLQHKPKMSEFVRPICLPYGELLHKNFTGSRVEVAGWGVADLSIGGMSKILQVVSLPVQPLSKCDKPAYTLDETQLCVGGEVGFDSCGGDSGGPLMKIDAVNGLPPRTYLLGLVSYGPAKCAGSTTPAVYTRVSSFLPWILDHIRP